MDYCVNKNGASASKPRLPDWHGIAAGVRACALICCVAAGVAVANRAHAADGTITITGNIVSPTCSPSGGSPGGKDFAVTLPDITTGHLPSNGSTSAATLYAISINGNASTCPNGTRVAIFYDPTSPQIDANGNLNLASNSTAAGVQIQVLSQTGTVLNLKSSTPSATVTVANGTASIGFQARYIATAPVKAGAAITSVRYTLTYP
jgi:major type 1 subunit fimbrin (pilin)